MLRFLCFLFRALRVERPETAPIPLVKFLRAVFRASTLAGLDLLGFLGPVVSKDELLYRKQILE